MDDQDQIVAVASPLEGRWTADRARSKPHPANPWRTATVVFEIDGDNVQVTDIVVDVSWREERHVNTTLTISADQQLVVLTRSEGSAV